MNILYIGSSGALSLLPFKTLLTSEHVISAVGIFKPITFNDKIIALENESLALSANQHDIPLIDLSQDVNIIIEQCKHFSIDIILMSCYGKRLQEDIISLPALGCFNMHPSLLPQYRGPEPLFWQMKEDSDKGVSWHYVTNDFDAGDVVITKSLYVDDGSDYAAIIQLLAEKGSQMMLELLTDIVKGSLQSSKQCIEMVSYQAYPLESDFVIETQWSAQHAYNFMKATEAFNQPYFCQIGVHRYLLGKALDYDNNDSLLAAEVQGDMLNIPFSNGVLTATFIDKLPSNKI